MKTKLWAKSYNGVFHVVKGTQKVNDALCGFIIPDKVSYQLIIYFPCSSEILCEECNKLGNELFNFETREGIIKERKEYLSDLVKMTNEELLEEHEYYNDEYGSGERYNVLNSYFRHKLRLCGFL